MYKQSPEMSGNANENFKLRESRGRDHSEGRLIIWYVERHYWWIKGKC